jgi:tRNA-dependent cyclodipeptide synthase
MLKVVPKNASGWQSYDTVCIGISMHTANHQGEALEGLLRWADGNFQDIIIDLSDTLHRHNYVAAGMTPELAWRKAAQDGEDWLAANKDLIGSLSASVEIIRWDHWLKHAKFQTVFNQFEKAFSTQVQFHDAVIADVAGFYKRKGEAGETEISEHQLNCSISYLLEEIAAHSIFCSEHRCAILYPGKQHSCYKLVREGLVDSVPDWLKNSFFTRMLVYNFDDKKTA